MAARLISPVKIHYVREFLPLSQMSGGWRDEEVQEEEEGEKEEGGRRGGVVY